MTKLKPKLRLVRQTIDESESDMCRAAFLREHPEQAAEIKRKFLAEYGLTEDDVIEDPAPPAFTPRIVEEE